MSEFADAGGAVWAVQIDGLILAELRDSAHVDIAQDGLYFIEDREDVLVKALLILCREQIAERKLTDRQFAKLIVGDATDRAIEAVRGAATNFFRPKKWSQVLSRCDQRRQIDELHQQLRPMFETLNRPEVDPEFRRVVMEALSEKIREATNSETSDSEPSASGLGVNPLSVVGDLLGSSEFIPKA